ncbi:MAG TPA: hypothetical protein H9888_07185 [Candidatus Rikenella faecigallinarum]|uniref:Resolvase/invertase-type recombinase catalytic domain-containing protein n=1 Tax=Candidatus Rikenella faecigallinarum TaxID=2838745 RepID=A0A9D1QFI3_9BACT|nr:hypothetical protein [Candidatus Rikenella faecigallinarum]
MIYGYFKLNANINNGHKKLIAIIQTGAQPENICFDALGSSAELTKLMTTLRQGDMLVVYSTVDIATAPAELTDMMDFLGKLGVSFVVVAEPWLSSSAQPERNGNPERILPANTHPRHGEVQKKSVGRPKGPQRDIIPKLDLALNLYHTAHHMSIRQICAMAKLNERTFYRHLERKGYQVIRRLKGRKPTKKYVEYLP